MLGADYRVIDVLGKGGMGVVYRVRHLASNEVQALKQLHPHLTGPLERARFGREFRLCQNLHHPLFLRVFRFHDQEQGCYYTMELVEGETLDVFLPRLRQSMPWEGWLDRFFEIIQSILEGLEYLHQQGVIHRDLKPQNILVTAQGETKLIDLGLAGQHHVSRATDKGTLLGTPHYIAPEMLQEMELDVRSDLYSLGVLIYEMLSGRLPFPQTDLMALLQNIMMQPAPPLEPLGPLPAGTADWLHSLLSKDPAERPTSAAQALQQWRTLFSSGSYLHSEKELVLCLLSAPLTGREQLLTETRAALAQKNRLVCLIGAGGVGKSKLLEALERRLRESKVVCHRMRPSGGQTPFEPWAKLLNKLLGKTLPPSLQASAPVLAGLLPRLGEARGGNRLELFLAVVRVLRLTMGKGWLLIDDLDQFAEEDLELVRFLLSQSGELPRLLCTADARSWWSLGLSGAVLTVEPLGDSDLLAMARASLGGRLEPELAQCLLQESAGNPLVAQELLKTLSQEKKLVRLRGVVSARQLTGVRLPELLQRRLSQLSPLQVELLFLIACARGRLTFEDLYAATGEPLHDLLGALESLLRLQMLHENSPGSYLMAQHLRAFLEGHLPQASLRGWHTQLALSLGRSGETAQAERVAYHWLQADAPQRAARPLEVAARRHIEARNHGRALALLEQLQQITPGGLSTELQERRADALYHNRHPAAAQIIYAQLNEREPQARLWRKISRCFWRAGDLSNSHSSILQAARSQQLRLPSQAWSSRLWTGLRFISLLLGTSWCGQSPGGGREQAKIEALLSRSLFFSRPPHWQTDYLFLLLRQISWHLEDDTQPGPLAQREITLGACHLLGPRHLFGRARQHLERGVDIALGMPSSGARAELLVDACYHLLCLGHPQLGQISETTHQITQQLGDPTLVLHSCHLLGLYHRLSGRLLHSQQAYAEAIWIVDETDNGYEREQIQAQQTILAALAGSALGERCETLPVGGTAYLHQQQQLARAYTAWRQNDLDLALLLSQARAGDYRGDLLPDCERRLLQASCQPQSRPALQRLQKASHELFPSFACAGLRLEAAQVDGEARRRLLRQALGLARRWQFPLEEGLIQGELACLDGDPVRYRIALEKLQEAGARARLPEVAPFQRNPP